MIPTVEFEVDAEGEYRSAARWYDDQRKGLGTEFLDAVDVTLARVARFPQLGARVAGVRADLLVRRAPVRRFPYHVIYMEVGPSIRVLAIAHDHRRPEYWADRVSS